MKCPYCGNESENQVCSKCFALIPADKLKEEPKEEPRRVRKNKDKE